MKKIGILTFHNSVNYGAVLQTYALYKTLEKNNYETYIINYNNQKIESNEKIVKRDNCNLKGFLKIISQGPYSRVKKRKFSAFLQKNFKLIKYNDANSLEGIVVGSDQVWNLNLTDYDFTYYLDDFDVDKKISYAASFGEVDLDNYNKYEINRYFEKLNAISIREQKDVSKVNKKFNINATSHVDPVFLLDKVEWCNLISKERLIKDDYIFVYYIKKSNKLFEYAEKLGKEKNMKVYVVNQNIIKSNPNFKHLRGKGVNEFLNYINNASYVVTNSFHGTALSIILNKSFKSEKFIGEKENSRVMNILNLLNLENRVIESDFTIDEGINYSEVIDKIQIKVKESVNYLKSNLD